MVNLIIFIEWILVLKTLIEPRHKQKFEINFENFRNHFHGVEVDRESLLQYFPHAECKKIRN